MTKLIAAGACAIFMSACGGAGTPTVTEANAPAVAEVNRALTDPAVSNGAQLASAASVTVSENTDFARILNNLRVDRDLSTLSYDVRLDRAAQKHAEDMVNRGYFSHYSPEGDGVRERIIAEGYEPRGWAENLAQGHQNEEQILQAWINSPGHDANLSAPLEEFAIGAAGEGSQLTWVLVLATEQ